MAKNLAKDAGKEAVKRLGWWRSHRFLFLRRVTQMSVLLAFFAGPMWGVWVLKGNLSASVLLDIVPFTDPLIAAQALATGHLLEPEGLMGLAIVIVIYALVAPRAFCGWVCPMNMVTDAAAWLRRKFNVKASFQMSASVRYWLLALLVIGSGVSGTLLWTWLDPVSALHRGLIFGVGGGIWLVASVFVLDLLLVEHGWCGHLCPLGASYGVIGSQSVMRVAAVKRSACTKCMDCFNVCPEPQVLRQRLKGGDVRVMDRNCMSCGRCIDVCAEQVLEFRKRFGAENEE
ncbi:quinol dehydrogenase ferredoxin subunit NapH [Enterovibrio nigricans]|uniref:Ferredoxin-type protein NapH n=1 Tax=Enterovibrio nigricans DSM 22720 TaxID=1121868 RepID=A0A1T4UQY5_9GAMM|nr:quinol dehydrogenase ferredoxin subunit NapH [Enterovibrio nigricans]SKA55028.1 ferredoxin-type protein NapH [Enterovibrio nigricans DSM 22720]